MTDTSRTTVTLSEFNMQMVEKLIGILGNTRAQVISAIVENYFRDEKNLKLIEKLITLKKDIEEEKVKEESKKIDIIEKKISNILLVADYIPLTSFLKYLNIDLEFFYDNVLEWKKKFNFKIENDKIIKIENNK
ncbi:MAG: hypothetical protein ACTSYC_09775 [Promethearchaeota archaeon]